MMSKISKAIALFGAGTAGVVEGREIYAQRQEKKASREEKADKRKRETAARDELRDITSRYSSMFQPQQLQPQQQTGSPVAAGVSGAPLQPEAVTAGPAGGVNVAGQQPQQPQQQPMPNAADLMAYSRELDTFSATHPEMSSSIASLRSNVTQLGNRQWAESFPGDKTSPMGSLEYVEYMAKSPYGAGYLKPEVAAEIATRMDKMEKDGYADILRFGHMGDVDQARAAWKKSGMPGELVELQPTEFQFGNTNKIIWKDKKGNQHSYNAGEKLYRGLSLKEQAKMALEGKSVVQTGKGTYVVDERDATGKKVVGMGGKLLAGKGAGGMKASDYMARKKNATQVFDKSIGVSKGEFGIEGLDEKNRKIYSQSTKFMYNLIESGVSDGEAANATKNLFDRALALKQAGSKNPIKDALKQADSSKSTKLPDWITRDTQTGAASTL